MFASFGAKLKSDIRIIFYKLHLDYPMFGSSISHDKKRRCFDGIIGATKKPLFSLSLYKKSFEKSCKSDFIILERISSLTYRRIPPPLEFL